MKAFLYSGPGTVELLDRPKPTIQAPTDAVVRLMYASICGTDLHILKGDVPSAEIGTILGHEGVGVIESLGSAVHNLQINQRVLISCITSCGVCRRCRGNLAAHCQTGGWILGNRIDGTQAEYVRILHASSSLYPLAPSIDPRAAVIMSDALPVRVWCSRRERLPRRICCYYRSRPCWYSGTPHRASLFPKVGCRGRAQ